MREDIDLQPNWTVRNMREALGWGAGASLNVSHYKELLVRLLHAQHLPIELPTYESFIASLEATETAASLTY